MRFPRLAIGGVLLALLASAPAGHAQSILDRVQARGAVACGAAPRPGIADIDDAGQPVGLAVDLCRAVAIAVLGPDARITFRSYESDRDFDRVRRAEDDIAFLGDEDIAARNLVPSVVPGPPVYLDPVTLMVPVDSPVRRFADMRGRMVCFMTAGIGQRALEAALARQHLEVARLAFQEESEMLDAYNVGRCDAVADEATALAALAQDRGIRDLHSRLLPDPLALSRVIVTTPTRDGRWSALVFWVLGAMQSLDRPASSWSADLALPPPLGIRAGWRDDLRAKLGSYGAAYRRNLGDASPLHLAVGPNAPWPQGLLLPPAPH